MAKISDVFGQTFGSDSDPNPEQQEQEQQEQELDGNGDGDAREQQQEEEERDQKLAEERLTKENIDFMFEIMTKEAKHDGLSVRQLFLGMMSTFTKLPIPHVINSRDTGAGKSYLLNHVSSFIPDRYQTVLAGTSEKTIFHKDGVMVYEDENHQVWPIQPVIADLQLSIEGLEETIDAEEQKKKENKPHNADLIKSSKSKQDQTDRVTNQRA
jgi:hypothetical protein